MLEKSYGYAEEYLEEHYLPLALSAAGLPADTSLEALEALNLPRFDDPHVLRSAKGDVGTLANQRPLFCGVVLALDSARDPRARRIGRAILGLMWRDIEEYAKNSALETSFAGFMPVPAEYREKIAGAEERFDKWQATDAPADGHVQDFLEDWVDYLLLGGAIQELATDPAEPPAAGGA